MKIKPEHYSHIAIAVAENMKKIPFSEYAQQGLSGMRYRWDLAHASGLTPWMAKTLYPYLNDEHIDTALRQITQTQK